MTGHIFNRDSGRYQSLLSAISPFFNRSKIGVYLFGTFVAAFAAIAGCKKPYQPATTSVNYNYLVVEGVINSGSDTTFIKLSRTTPISKSATVVPEVKATLSVESDQNALYPLKETTNGTYIATGLNLDNSRKYRLRIKTLAGKTYLSDFVAVKNSPAVDSVGYTITGNGIDIYANSHDATNNTRYYRWDFQETWKFHSQDYSGYYTDGKQLLIRGQSQQIFYCFAHDLSDNVILGSTAKLTQDVVYQNLITSVPYDSEKLGIRYSILVKEYALTADAYAFWSNIKTNTEQLGSIFSAQPSELKGNIHNVADPTETVIGFVTVGVVQSKRIFIDRSELPADWRITYTDPCRLDTAFFSQPKTRLNLVKQYLIPKPPLALALDSLTDVNGAPIGYSFSTFSCTDCSLRGNLQPPSFWK